jgi:hypothetical protein
VPSNHDSLGWVCEESFEAAPHHKANGDLILTVLPPVHPSLWLVDKSSVISSVSLEYGLLKLRCRLLVPRWLGNRQFVVLNLGQISGLQSSKTVMVLFLQHVLVTGSYCRNTHFLPRFPNCNLRSPAHWRIMFPHLCNIIGPLRFCSSVNERDMAASFLQKI